MTAPTNDLKFGTDGWRAVIADDYTFENLSRVTRAVEHYLKRHAKDAPKVMLGYDCRFNGEGFARAVARQLASAGVKVFLSPGFVSTPMVSLATMMRQTDLGIVITASHNPPAYNGFKLKGPYGGPAYPAMIAEVEELVPDEPIAVTAQFDELVEAKQIEYYDMESLYLNHLKQAFDWPAIQAAGIGVAYDAMYGAGQRVMRKLFPAAELLHCEFNPSFHGQAPEPIERNLGELKELVQTNNIPFGLANDGDADRIGLFDQHGNFVDSHHIILLLIHYLHHHKEMSGKVVVTFSVTDKVRKLCEHYGLELEITKIGFKYIGEIMGREDILVGGEESGGIAVAGHAPERDGIYIGLVLLEMMAATGKTLPELSEELYELVGPFAMGRRDLHLSPEVKTAAIEACRNGGFRAFGDYAVQEVETIDGFKFHLPDESWVMVRPSGTEPVLRVYAESRDAARVDRILEAAVNSLQGVAAAPS